MAAGTRGQRRGTGPGGRRRGPSCARRLLLRWLLAPPPARPSPGRGGAKQGGSPPTRPSLCMDGADLARGHADLLLPSPPSLLFPGGSGEQRLRRARRQRRRRICGEESDLWRIYDEEADPTRPHQIRLSPVSDPVVVATISEPIATVVAFVSEPIATVSHSHPSRPLVLLPLPPHGQEASSTKPHTLVSVFPQITGPVLQFA
ncbi:unnamed protein product [Miscanthus lutarioriparius]|uniref:Uncharacterized protein n=1 Tax=Miscanthus lutarioriparius TaxID=422564 RepID=A0A811QHF3_9POAL|nr:unnamed protein product [Miscanthus lutarioriparius]